MGLTRGERERERERESFSLLLKLNPKIVEVGKGKPVKVQKSVPRSNDNLLSSSDCAAILEG